MIEDYNFKNLTGKVLDSVALSDDQQRFTLKFQDGTTKSYGVEGDCCSSSWIEHLELPSDVQGATIQSVEDGGGVPYDNHVCVAYDYSESDDENKTRGACGHDSLTVYNTRFRTDKGDIVLEYRNDSNGYYGGYLVDAD